MLYVRGMSESRERVIVPIDGDNVFSYCPSCGKEVEVELSQFWNDEDFDYQETELYCERCSEKLLEVYNNEC